MLEGGGRRPRVRSGVVRLELVWDWGPGYWGYRSIGGKEDERRGGEEEIGGEDSAIVIGV